MNAFEHRTSPGYQLTYPRTAGDEVAELITDLHCSSSAEVWVRAVHDGGAPNTPLSCDIVIAPTGLYNRIDADAEVEVNAEIYWLLNSTSWLPASE